MMQRENMSQRKWVLQKNEKKEFQKNLEYQNNDAFFRSTTLTKQVNWANVKKGVCIRSF